MDNTAPNSIPTPRRFQFSLRTSLEVTAVVACLCAGWTWHYRQQRLAMEGVQVNDTLALNALVAIAAGNARITAQGGAHGQGADTDYWLIAARKSDAFDPNALLEKLDTLAASRLSELGADVKQSALAGWGDNDSSHSCAAGRQIIYRFGNLRGVIVMRAAYVPGLEPTIGLTVENVQFR